MIQPQSFTLGIRTSGGDAPGMNSCMRAAVRTAFDRMLAARMGARAVIALVEGHSGMMTAPVGCIIELVPSADGISNKQPADLECYHMARMLAR